MTETSRWKINSGWKRLETKTIINLMNRLKKKSNKMQTSKKIMSKSFTGDDRPTEM